LDDHVETGFMLVLGVVSKFETTVPNICHRKLAQLGNLTLKLFVSDNTNCRLINNQ